MKDTSAPLSRFGPRRRWLIWLAYLAVWTTLLLVPHPSQLLPRIPSGGAWLRLNDLAHIGGYGLLTGLGGWLRPGRRRWWLLAFVSLHAVGTELLQSLGDWRTADLSDVGFNHVGIALGLLLTWKWWRPA